MAIERIDLGKCTRCGMCEYYCPMDVIRFNSERQAPEIKYPEDCMVCGLCEARCPVKSILVTPHKEGRLALAWG